MNTAEVLVKCLEQEGVRYVFGIPGEENLAVIHALQDSPIEFVTVRHEQGAAFMADVYGRLTGRAGVCLSTLGPGATNLITGVADATLDGAPLVAISGQVGTDRMHYTSHQYLDLVEMFRPITKASHAVVRPDTMTEIVRQSFKNAQLEKPGAAFIDLPCNIAEMEVEEAAAQTPIEPSPHMVRFAGTESIERAAGLISQARRPVILAGQSVIRNNASGAINAIAEQLKIPVVNTMMAKGVIPLDSPYSLWTIGLAQDDWQNVVLDRADLVIAVGYDVVEYAPRRWNSRLTHKVIHIGTSPSAVNRYYKPEVEVVGDISNSLRQIMLRCHRDTVPEWAFKIRARMVDEQRAYEKDDSFPMKPQRILCDVRRALGPDDILVSDVGAHKMWIARHYNCYRPNTCIISNGFATMGIGVPGALAAKLVHPDRRVLTITGDGGFMMNMQELETAVRYHVPFVTLIFRDGAYGLIKWKQQDKYGDSAYVDFNDPDFVLLADSMGCAGYRITAAEELAPTLEKAFSQDVPVIIDCAVDYGENEKLTQHLTELYASLSK